MSVPSRMLSQTGMRVTSTVPSQASSAWLRQSCVSVVEVTPMALTITSHWPPIWYSVQSPVGSGESQK